MANTIVRLKRSSVPGKVPDAANLQVGELALNLADRIIYTKNGTGNVIVIGAATTSNVTEGVNLYFSNARARSAFTSGNGIILDNTTGIISANTTYLATVLVANISTSNIGDLADVDTTTYVPVSGNVLIFNGTNWVPGSFPTFAETANVSNTVLSLSNFTTSNVAEGSNLYYTNARVYANVITLGYATTGYVDSSIANLVNSAPAALDTLNELANALANDASFSTTITNQLASKASSNDLTTSNVIELGNLYFTNVRARDALTSTNGINYDPSTGTFSSGLRIELVDLANVANVSVANVNTIQFDSDSGFDVIDRANGIAKIAMNSTFKTWNVLGQANLVATGLDVVRFIPGNNITITTNAAASPQEIRFDAANVDVSNKANIVDLTTANVTELTNLYFTNARVYSNVIELGYITSSYVDSAIANLVNSAPAALDTLYELANALGNDASFSTTITNLIGSKANSSDLTTANVLELTNLYFTNARVYANVTPLLDLKANVVDLTTSNVIEGSNLYFTNARVRAAISGEQGINVSANGIITLANTAVLPGVYGSSNIIPVITVDAQGRITNVANANVASTSGAITGIEVGLINSSNVTSNVVNDVTNLYFDTNSAFGLQDLGNGNVKLTVEVAAGGATFRNIQITGQNTLTAVGVDTLELVQGQGIQLTTNVIASPKQLTIATTGLGNLDGGFFDSVYGGTTALDAGGP